MPAATSTDDGFPVRCEVFGESLIVNFSRPPGFLSENPCSSPGDTAAATLVSTDVAGRSLQTIARQTFLAWEKLRLLYVVLLALVTVLLVAGTGHFNRRVVVVVFEGAIVANIAYFRADHGNLYSLAWL